MSSPTASDSTLNGGCRCGAVRYRCGPLVRPPSLCHCVDCRRTVGAHIVGWCTVTAASLHLDAHGALREYASSPRVTRTFCGLCGTSLTWSHADHAGLIDVTLASFDDAAALAPTSHIWMQDALPWDKPAPGENYHTSERDEW
jgi:hypothetical protein